MANISTLWFDRCDFLWSWRQRQWIYYFALHVSASILKLLWFWPLNLVANVPSKIFVNVTKATLMMIGSGSKCPMRVQWLKCSDSDLFCMIGVIGLNLASFEIMFALTLVLKRLLFSSSVYAMGSDFATSDNEDKMLCCRKSFDLHSVIQDSLQNQENTIKRCKRRKRRKRLNFQSVPRSSLLWSNTYLSCKRSVDNSWQISPQVLWSDFLCNPSLDYFLALRLCNLANHQKSEKQSKK